MYVCMSEYMHMCHVCAPCMSHRGQKPALNSLELELQEAVSFPVEVLGAEPRFSAEQQVPLTSRPSLESASLATFVSRCCSQRLSSSCPPRDMEQSIPSVPCLVFSSFFFFFTGSCIIHFYDKYLKISVSNQRLPPQHSRSF